MTGIRTLKASRLAPALERVISKAITESLAGEPVTRCQIVGERPEQSLLMVGDELSTHAGCVFAQVDVDGRRVTSIIRAEDAFKFVEAAALSQEAVSFVFDKGAITAAFGVSDDGARMELHIVSWGVMRVYAEKVALDFGGVLY